ncbi:inositol-pentakisphosphate 2-kinase isoform X2 [Periplaneta americana]|uniref:inositol-pentakisphosphate 2-kinase isoform X2 n=1 Tax=Periplaneta americana TaxID=6978 RepID=UPI0037E84B83
MLDSVGGDARAPRRFSLRNKKWKYRGEGNANLVLALPQERKILRLRKCDGDVAKEAEDLLAEREREHVWREAVFCRGIMAPLLGECYIQPPTAARMDRAEVKRLDQILRTQRPAHRNHKSLQFGYVTVYPDYALLPLHLSASSISSPTATVPPTFCVEIKPKQGWIPSPDRRLPKCTFCLNQYLKLKNGSIRSRSLYCPLDLFSGNRARMMKALKALVAAPQNNLKIFKDGVLVYGEETCNDLSSLLQDWFCDPLETITVTDIPRLVDQLCCLVLEALCRDLTGREKLSDSETDNDSESDIALWERGCQNLLRPNSLPDGYGSNRQCRMPGTALIERIPSGLVAAVTPLLPGPPCDWSAQSLPVDCILARILRVQKLERTGSDRVYEAFRTQSCMNQLRAGNAAVADYGYVASMLSAGTGAGSGLSPLHRYLLATTAKDCSIMLAFQRLPPDNKCRTQNHIPAHHVVRESDGHAHVMNVGVTDLDPKPLSCIEKHRKRDCEVLTACLELLGPQTAHVGDTVC